MRTEFINKCMEGNAFIILVAKRRREKPGHRPGLAAQLRSMAQARPEPIDRRVARRFYVGGLPRQSDKFHLLNQWLSYVYPMRTARTIVLGKAVHNNLPPPTPVERRGAKSNLVPGAAGR